MMKKDRYRLVMFVLFMFFLATTCKKAKIEIIENCDSEYPAACNTGIKGAGVNEADLVEIEQLHIGYKVDRRIDVIENGEHVTLDDNHTLVKNGNIEISETNVVVKMLNVRKGILVYDGFNKSVTIKECLISAELDYGYGISCVASAPSEPLGTEPITIEYCTLHNGNSSKAITANNAIIKYCDVSGFNDGIYLHSNNLVENCYIHDLTTIGSDPHSDAFQCSGGRNNVIRHNTTEKLEPKINSSLILAAQNGDLINFTAEDNWFNGGNYIMQIRMGSHVPPYELNNINIINNTIVKGSQETNYPVDIQVDDYVQLTFKGNKYDDGTPFELN